MISENSTRIYWPRFGTSRGPAASRSRDRRHVPDSSARRLVEPVEDRAAPQARSCRSISSGCRDATGRILGIDAVTISPSKSRIRRSTATRGRMLRSEIQRQGGLLRFTAQFVVDGNGAHGFLRIARGSIRRHRSLFVARQECAGRFPGAQRNRSRGIPGPAAPAGDHALELFIVTQLDLPAGEQRKSLRSKMAEKP